MPSPRIEKASRRTRAQVRFLDLFYQAIRASSPISLVDLHLFISFPSIPYILEPYNGAAIFPWEET